MMANTAVPGTITLEKCRDRRKTNGLIDGITGGIGVGVLHIPATRNPRGRKSRVNIQSRNDRQPSRKRPW